MIIYCKIPNPIYRFIQVNSCEKLPIDYIIDSKSSLNLICFLVYDFNTPNRVGHSSSLESNFNQKNTDKSYFLELKNKQYIKQTGETIFEKLYSIIEEEKNQEICIQIINELLKDGLMIQDVVKKRSIDDFFKTKDTYYRTEILKLLSFYFEIEEKLGDFIEKSPFCKLIMNLKKETENTFEALFVRYLDEMKIKYKGRPNLHQITLQKDRKYLLDYKTFSEQYRTIENNFYINREIPEDSDILDFRDDYIFGILTPRQEKIQKQIIQLVHIKEENENEDKQKTEEKQYEKILKTIDNQEIEILLLARSQENPENILEEKLRDPNTNNVDNLLKKLCSEYGMETFYTKKMLLMVIIKI